MKDDRLFVSIVVSAYSKSRLIDLIDLINRICSQTYKYLEVIVIIDEDAELYTKISDLKSKIDIDISIIFNPTNNGLSYSRNIGISYAKGEIIAFIDDDAIPDNRWIENLIVPFGDSNIGATTGDVLPIWEQRDMSWFPYELFWMISCSYIMTPSRTEEVERGFGTNMAFRKELLQKAGLFDTNLGLTNGKWIGGEDTSMFINIKELHKKVIFIPEARVYHKISKNRLIIRNLLKRAFYGGYSVAAMRSVRTYYLNKSTESNYIKHILFKFYPEVFSKFLISPSKTYVMQCFIVSSVIFMESLGFLYGSLKIRNDSGV